MRHLAKLTQKQTVKLLKTGSVKVRCHDYPKTCAIEIIVDQVELRSWFE
jgi:hypothetical protein